MAHTYNLNDYPFMTCIVKVNTRYNWQKTVVEVLEKCHGVYNFKLDDNGLVEFSGRVDPERLLKKLGRARYKAELRWFQFGECSSNLFMPPSNIARPSHENIIRPSSYHHNRPFHLSYNHNPPFLQFKDHNRPFHPCYDHNPPFLQFKDHNRPCHQSYDHNPPFHQSYDHSRPFHQSYDQKHGYCHDHCGNNSPYYDNYGDDGRCCVVM